MFKRCLIGAALAISLSACGTPLGTAAGVLTGGPATVANKTVVDEKALIAAESAFHATLVLTNAAVDGGLLKGANAAKAKDILVKGHAALVLARTAYDAGNATSMASAITQAQSLAGQLAPLVGK